MTAVAIPYKPKPKQLTFHQSTADECFFGGAKGPGKSLALVMDAFEYALAFPGSDPHLFRESYDELEGNLIKQWKDHVPSDFYVFKETKHEARIRTNGTESVVKFRYVTDPVNAKRYDGRSIPYVGIDELAKHERATAQILMSCMRSAQGWPVMFRGTGNPGGQGHKWVRDRYVHRTNYGRTIYTDPESGNSVQFIPATVYDGVLTENDPKYVKRLENLPEKERRAYLHGDWDIFEGMFFEQFGPHLKAPGCPRLLPSDCILYGSLDHGTTAPTSFGLWWEDYTGRPHRIWTYYYPWDKENNPAQDKRTTHAHALAIANGIRNIRWTHGRPPKVVVADPSMWTKVRNDETFQASPIDYYQDVFSEVFSGFRDYRTAFVKANNDKAPGCEVMQEMYNTKDGVPNSFYWDVRENEPYELLIPLQQHDNRNPEVYDTKLEDHIADDTRYYMTWRRGLKLYATADQAYTEDEAERQSIKNPYRERYMSYMRPLRMAG